MRGTLTSSGRIQVVESQCSIYVSRTKKTVTETDIIDHIKDMGEECVSVELLKQYHDTTFNSFKITILTSKINRFLSTDFWPKDLVYRRYRERVAHAVTKTTQYGQYAK